MKYNEFFCCIEKFFVKIRKYFKARGLIDFNEAVIFYFFSEFKIEVVI